MISNARHFTLFAVLVQAALLAGCGGSGELPASHGAQTAESIGTIPARLHQARQVFDLAEFTLPEGAEQVAPASLSTLRFAMDGPIPKAFEQIRATLGASGWQLHDEPQTSESSASALLSKAGWIMSLTLMPQASQDRVLVALQQHGNLSPSALPRPVGASAVYEGPHAAVYRVPGSPEQIADAMRQTLQDDAWEPYGSSDGQIAHYRRHAIRMTVRSSAVPGQSDQSTLSINAELLSAELPSLPGAEELQFDATTQSLRFAHEGTIAKLIEDYDDILGAEGWTRSLEKPTNIEGRLVMTWRNAERDQLRLGYNEPGGGHQNVTLSYQSRQQIDEMNRRLDAQVEAYRAARTQ